MPGDTATAQATNPMLVPSAVRDPGPRAHAVWNAILMVAITMAIGPGVTRIMTATPSQSVPPNAVDTLATAETPAPTCGSLQVLIDRAPAGSTLHLPDCLYRESITIDKPLTVVSTGAEIRGSDVWRKWAPAGRFWVSALRLPRFITYGPCAPGTSLCSDPEQVYFDGNPLTHVAADPTSGQFALTDGRAIVLAKDPAGHAVEVTTRTRWVDVRADGVTIEGMRMRYAANPPQAENGAVRAVGVSRFSLRDCVLSDASGVLVGIVGGSGHQVIGNDLTRGGQAGFGLSQVSNTRVAENHIHGNNTLTFDTGWEAGGGKIGRSREVVIDSNEVDHNVGPGIWFDENSQQVTIWGNRVHDNTNAGIMFEVSNGALISGNAVWENGWSNTAWGWGAGILISSSANAEVANNTLAWNADGISVISQNRAGVAAVTGNYVHDNTVALAPQPSDTSDKSLLGWLQDWSGVLYLPSSNNRGATNDYWDSVPEPQWARFVWDGSQDTLAAFNATPGGGGNSTYLTTAQLDQALGAARIPLTPRAH